MTEVYFSGIEGSLDELKVMFDNGYKINNLMTSFASFRRIPKFIEELKEMKDKYKFKLIVDSGAHAFLFALNVKNKKITKGWHDEAQIVKEFEGREEEYFEEYFNWLDTHRDYYDYAVELDIATVVGEEKVSEWRKKLAESKLPIIYVLHANAGDTFKTVEYFKELGATYIGIGALPEEFNKMLMFAREIRKNGMSVHIFAFTPKELFKYKDILSSVDSTSWLSGSKLAKAVELKGKSLVDVNLKEDKLKKMSILRDKFFDMFGRKKVEEKTKGNQYWYFNFWNLSQYQKWADKNNGVKGYTKQLQEIEEGVLPAPSWMNNFDKNGMPKTKYLASRFNNYRSGAFAKGIQSMAMFCDMCPVGGQSATGEPLCPKYGAGEVCFFLPYWKKLGMNTRNKQQVVRTLEDLVAEAIVRWQFARFQEQLTGVIDKNVTALYKELVSSLELYNRVAFGVQNVNTLNMLNIGDNKVQVSMNFDDALEKVREVYGEKLSKKIEKKITEAYEKKGENEEIDFTENKHPQE